MRCFPETCHDHIQIGLLMLLGISAFVVITLYLDFWRASKAQRENK
ncbi:hypothetical protein QNM99_14890 [Pseudomonas sp. PCH446]